MTNEEILELKELSNRVLTPEEFEVISQKYDLCFAVSDERISDDVEEYCFEASQYLENLEDFNQALERAKKVKLYKKIRYRLSGEFLLEAVQDNLSDCYGYDTDTSGYLEDAIGEHFFDDIAEKFNKKFEWYTSEPVGVGFVDLSRELEDYVKNYYSEIFED